jgi:tRNA threonylcarbamoyl adenosine modification protein YeaZ
VSARWLAIDTATDLASIAVGIPPGFESVTQLAGPRVQGAAIIELVDRCLSPLGLRPVDLAGIIVGDGPGGFTGLRIGWSAAKGLAQERSLPLLAIPSLLAAAAGAAAIIGAVPIASCIDALRGEVFGAIYVVHRDRVETIVAAGVGTPESLVARAPVRPRAVVADTMHHAAFAESWSGAPLLSPAVLRPTAVSLLALHAGAGAGRWLEDLSTAEPEYGREAEAQARWEARHGRPLPDPSRASG